MKQFSKKIAILALSFVLVPTHSARAQQAESIETFGGAWDTNWGEVWVTENGDGTYSGSYEEDNGRFWLEFTDHVFEGIWAEDLADIRCDTPKMGSYYWRRSKPPICPIRHDHAEG